MSGGHWRLLGADRVLVVDQRLSETLIHHKSASSPRQGRRARQSYPRDLLFPCNRQVAASRPLCYGSATACGGSGPRSSASRFPNPHLPLLSPSRSARPKRRPTAITFGYVSIIQVRPSMSSRTTSRWPTWHAVSPITCSMISRTVLAFIPGQMSEGSFAGGAPAVVAVMISSARAVSARYQSRTLAIGTSSGTCHASG
jgi:hypothetical protein